MGLLDKVIDKGADALFGGGDEERTSIPPTNFDSFVSKFSPMDEKYIESLDPLQTFEVSFKFYPSISKDYLDKKKAELKEKRDKESKASRLGRGLLKKGVSALGNAANNATGGLLGSLSDKKNKDQFDVNIQKTNFEYKNEHTFLEYAAKVNLLTGENSGTQTFGDKLASSLDSKTNIIEKELSLSPLDLNLGLYVQSITIPNLKVDYNGKTNSAFGEFNLPGEFVATESNILQMNILNTKASLHERIFYPWMREVTLPFWSYDTQPYTTATITVDFNKHNTFKYVFVGCRPVNINSMQPTQEPNGEISRKVTFLFDAMFIESDLKMKDSIEDKFIGTGKTLLKGASKFIKL